MFSFGRFSSHDALIGFLHDTVIGYLDLKKKKILSEVLVENGMWFRNKKRMKLFESCLKDKTRRRLYIRSSFDF